MPVATAYPEAGVIAPDSMSSTQWPAVRMTLGATTVPVQAKMPIGCSSAWMKASEGNSAIDAARPPITEAWAGAEWSASAAVGIAAPEKALPRHTTAVTSPTREIKPPFSFKNLPLLSLGSGNPTRKSRKLRTDLQEPAGIG